MATRREFLAGVAASVAGWSLLPQLLAAEGGNVAKYRLGICDWSTGAKAEGAFAIAKEIGLEGVQISPRGAADKLSYADPAEQAMYRELEQKTGLKVSGLALTVGNEFPLATDPRAPAWLEQTIDATAALGAKSILLAFFAKGDLLTGDTLKTKEVDTVVARLKEAAPRAKAKGVILGLENWLSAQDNLMIMDRVGSDALQVYYDLANSTKRGYDVPAEIRQLKGRICEFHFKDGKGLLGEGDVKLAESVAAIKDINYTGWVILENHFGDRVDYFRKNAAISRKALGLA